MEKEELLKISTGESFQALDELNLVEFPLAVLSDTAPKGRKTIEFVDSIHDRNANEQIERRCIVTGSDKWGLPNWFDIDILLAALRLTQKQHQFREPTLRFSLYGIREQLRIPRGGRRDRRIAEGLLRIIGTTVAYQNGWRQNEKWKSVEAFLFIDNLSLSQTQQFYDEDVVQQLKWNDRIIESVRNKNIKPLDWEFYVSLRKPTAKRLYRFLDKRFYLRKRWKYRLQEFCPNKVGMKSGLPAWRYRDNLKPGIFELVEKGFLVDLGDKLFVKEGNVSFVNFQRASTSRRRPVKTGKTAQNLSPIEQRLVAEGVSIDVARRLSSGNSAQRIEEQIENFADRRKQGEPLGSGWLIRAIESKDGFGFRPGYVSKKEIDRQFRLKIERRKDEKIRKQHQKESEVREQTKRTEAMNRLHSFMNAVSAEERKKLEDEALEGEAQLVCLAFLAERREGRVGLYHQLIWDKTIIPALLERANGVQ